MSTESMRQVEALLNEHFRPIGKTMTEIRAQFAQLAMALPPVKGASVESVEAGGRPALMVRDGKVREDCALLFLHGGGYNCGTPELYQDMMARLSKAARAPVLGPDYRLAPEHKYPAASDDAVAAYEWLLAGGLPASHLALVGDSAGGGLTLATLLRLRDEKISLPACAVAISPWTDLLNTGDSLYGKAAEDPWLRPEGAEICTRLYVGRDGDPKVPYASPLYGELTGLPPLLIQVGTREILLDDSIRFAEKAKAAGVDVTLEIWEEMVHVWQFFAGILPEGQRAIDDIGNFIRRRVTR